MLVVNSRFLTQEITGVQRFAIEISLRLKDLLKDSVMFVAPSNVIQNDIAKQLDATIIGKHTGYLWEQWDLPRYLKKQGNLLLLNMCNIAPIFYKNQVTVVHDIAFERYPQNFSKKILLLYKTIIPLIIKNSRRIITVSDFSKREIVDAYRTNANKIDVVHSAPCDVFCHKSDKILENEKYFLAVSSLNYRKNFITALKAFEKFCSNDQDISFYLVGDIKSGLFGDVDLGQIANNPRVKFLGRISDEELVKYYSNALGFIFPSLYEGFGLPPLEAQKCGCPVLCADISPLREVCADSAIYATKEDANAFAEYMERLLFDVELRKSLIDKGFENVKRFSFDISTNHILKIIDNKL